MDYSGFFSLFGVDRSTVQLWQRTVSHLRKKMEKKEIIFFLFPSLIEAFHSVSSWLLTEWSKSIIVARCAKLPHSFSANIHVISFHLKVETRNLKKRKQRKPDWIIDWWMSQALSRGGGGLMVISWMMIFKTQILPKSFMDFRWYQIFYLPYIINKETKIILELQSNFLQSYRMVNTNFNRSLLWNLYNTCSVPVEIFF